MTPFYNLPPEQRCVQRLAAQFKADEQLWWSLESKPRRRRKMNPRTLGNGMTALAAEEILTNRRFLFGS
jgi:hypothetical protein